MYDAVLDASLWTTVLEGIADPTDSAAALIHGYSVDRKIYTFHELGRIDPDCKRRHELYHVANPWMRASRFTAGCGVLRRVDPLAQLKRTGFLRRCASAAEYGARHHRRRDQPERRRPSDSSEVSHARDGPHWAALRRVSCF
jgi:hypothetical protein